MPKIFKPYMLLLLLLLTSIGFAKDDFSIRNDLLSQTCERGQGPWYILDEQNRILRLDQSRISFLNDKGTVLFCEGESFFSGIVTTNEVNFIGYGDIERIVVMPVMNQYFNIISLKPESLYQLFSMIRITQDDLTLTGIEIEDYPEALISPESTEKLNISIENITFTQDNNYLSKLESDDNNNGLNFESSSIFDFNMLDEEPLVNKIPAIDGSETRNGHSPGAIQINRMDTDLRMNTVVFKSFSRTHPIVLHTNLDLKMNDVEFRNNEVKFLLVATKSMINAEIVNLDVSKNLSAGFHFQNSDYEHPDNSKIQLKDVNFSKNSNAFINILGMSASFTRLSFERNGLGTIDQDYPGSAAIHVIANRDDVVQIHESNFIENNNFELNIFNGFGTITESNFIYNQSQVSILQLYGIEHNVINSKFEKNEISNILGLIHVNSIVSLIDSYVVGNTYNYEPDMGPYSIFSIIGPRIINVPSMERFARDTIYPREITRKIYFKNTLIEHSRDNDVTIIGVFDDLEIGDSPIVEFKRFDEGLNTRECFWDGRTLCR